VVVFSSLFIIDFSRIPENTNVKGFWQVSSKDTVALVDGVSLIIVKNFFVNLGIISKD